MAIVGAQVFYQFGLRPNVSGNVLFKDEDVIIYPSGANCVLFNLNDRSQQILTGNEKSQGITALAISDNKRFFAMAEKGNSDKGEKPLISIYDIKTMRRKKILAYTEMHSDRFNCLAFSADAKCLGALGGLPNRYLVLWVWDRSKILSALPLTIVWELTPTQPVNSILFNLVNNRHVCVAGSGIFKQYHYQGSAMTVFMEPEEPYRGPQSYRCMAWASEEWLLLGLDCNLVLLLENGELKKEFVIITDGIKSAQSPTPESEEVDPCKGEEGVRAIVAFEKGFACSCGDGLVHLFEKTDDDDYYRKLVKLEIGLDPGAGDLYGVETPKQYITSLAVSPSGGMLVASSGLHQVYSFDMSVEITKSENTYLDVVGYRLHSNAITGCDICVRKQLIVTCSLDCSIRVWNYQLFKLEIYKVFNEMMFSISLHPSGLFILLGFDNSLRLMNILIDDILPFKEFPVKACAECMFCNGGQMFAAVHGNVIEVYSTVTFDCLSNLKGHSGKVRSIAWSENDLRLISSGLDGAIYEWDVLTGKRLSENVLKGCGYTSVVLSNDGKTIYALGSDMLIKEISDSLIQKEVPTDNTLMTKLVLSHGGRILIVGMAHGSIRSMRYPLTIPEEWLEFQGHSAPITRMRMTYDDRYLITVSEDSALIIWKILDQKARGIRKEKDVMFAKEILVTKADIEEKDSLTRDLSMRVSELKSETQYQLRMRDLNYNEKLNALVEDFTSDMEELKKINQDLKSEREQGNINHEAKANKLVESFITEMDEIETLNRQKLMGEFEKYQELKEKGLRMQEDYERQLEEMEEKMERTLEEFTDEYEGKLQELNRQCEKSDHDFSEHMRECQETKEQIEQDADYEIMSLKASYEHKLADERRTILKLKAEINLLKKRIGGLQKDIDDHRLHISKLKTEISKLNNTILLLEKDISGLKKEVLDRDDTIQEKEKRLYELKKKNQDLEKFKYVLDNRIEGLKKTIEPKDNEIKALRKKIGEEEDNLRKFYKDNKILERNIEDEKVKLRAAFLEIKDERLKNQVSAVKLTRLKNDIHDLTGMLQDPKRLKEKIVQVFHKQVTKEDIESEEKIDEDYKNELAHQKAHLQEMIAGLQKQFAKEVQNHKSDNARVMQENVTLLGEITDLRDELKVCRIELGNMENAMEIGRKNKKYSASEVLSSIAEKPISANLVRELEEAKKVIILQAKEKARLEQELCQLTLS